jgi:hypothetical protein
MADLVGTAYVRIRAITAGLASDISDGVDKGVKDAGPSVDKSGEKLGGRLGDGAGDGFSGRMETVIGDGVDDAGNSPTVHKKARATGAKVTDSVGDGVDEQSKKKNPFETLADSIFDPFAKLGKNLPGGPKLWSAIFAPDVIGFVAPLAQAAIAGVTAAVGQLVTAAAGAGVALAGVFAVAAPGIGVLAAALKADTEELDAFKKASEDLLKPWKQVAVATQKELFPALEDAMKTMQHMVPLFAEFGAVIGKSAGNFVKLAAATLTNERNMGALAGILDDSVSFWDNIESAALAFVDTLMPFLKAASPLAVQLSDSIRTMAEHFRDFILNKSATGELTTTFQTWYDRLTNILGILGNLGEALFNVFSVGADASDSVFQSIGDITQGWADWTASLEGKNALKDWFDQAMPLLSEIWGLAQDLFQLGIKPLFIGGDTSAMMSFIKVIREDFLPIIQTMSDAIGEPAFRNAVGDLAEAIGSLIKSATAEGGATAFSVAMDLITKAIQALADLLSTQAGQEIGTELVKIALGLAVLAKVSSTAKDIKAGLANLLDPLVTIGATPVGAVFLALAAAVLIFIEVWQHWDEIVDGLKALWEWFTKLNGPMKVFVGILGALVVLFNPLGLGAAAILALVAALKNFDVVKDAVISAVQAIGDFISGLPDRILEGLGDLPQVLLDAVRGIPDALATIIPQVTQALAGIGQAIVSGLGEALTSLGDFGQGLLDSIGSALSDLGPKLKEGLLTGLENLPGAIIDALAGLTSLGQTIIGLIGDGLLAALPALVGFVAQIPGAIIRFITAALPVILSVGTQIIGFILRGLASALPQIGFFFLRLPLIIATFLRRAIVSLAKLGAEMIGALAKGIIENRGRIFDFFVDLPGNILKALISAVGFLLELGGQITQALLDGLESTVGAIIDFFKALPRTMIDAIGDTASMLIDVGRSFLSGFLAGAQSFLGSVNEFFGGLPQMVIGAIGDLFGVLWAALQIGADLFLSNVGTWALGLVNFFLGLPLQILGAIGDLFGLLWTGVQAGADLFLSNVGTWILGVVNFFLGLPGQVLGAVGDLGSTLWSAIAGGFATALSNIGTWVSDAWDKFVEFASEAPGKVASLVTDLPAKIGEATVAALAKITTWVTDALNKFGEFVSGIPGKFVGFTTTLWNSMESAFTTALSNIKQWVEDALAAVGNFIISLPKKLAGMLGDAISAIGSFLKNAWNSAVDRLPSIGGQTIGFGPVSFTIPTFDPSDWLHLHALGGIFDKAHLGVVAEAGSEAIIPMTRPARALSLLRESGLDRLVIANSGQPGAAGQQSPVTLLKIDTAVMTAPVDADLVVQKITSAWRRMAV